MRKQLTISNDDIQNFIDLHGRQANRDIEWLKKNVGFCEEIKNNPIGKVLFSYLNERIAELMNVFSLSGDKDIGKSKMALHKMEAYKEVAEFIANKMGKYQKIRSEILETKNKK